jgi:hypothetical protein
MSRRGKLIYVEKNVINIKKSILLNIMFHALIEIFHLELFYLFFHRRPTHKLCFLSCRYFVVNAAFSTGLVVSSVSWLVQLTVGV